MLGRLLHRRLGVGAEVTVLAGPYAGHSGRITDVAGDGRLTVFIDDCCQPVVSPANVSLGRSTSFGDRVDAAHRIIHENPEFERTRAMAKRRTLFGWLTRGG